MFYPLRNPESDNKQGGGMPGTPGLFTPEHLAGWKKVVAAVHAKGAFIYAQLWHQGRTTISPMTGKPGLSPSGLPWDNDQDKYSYTPVGFTGPVLYKDYPPVEMSVEDIKSTIGEYCLAARLAVEECGFDGVEVHGGNGYVFPHWNGMKRNARTVMRRLRRF
jgi:2,4-dienoyl-CoA reductase-like NADH-dependent reductase (Old Yellow Enzyme family)